MAGDILTSTSLQLAGQHLANLIHPRCFNLRSRCLRPQKKCREVRTAVPQTHTHFGRLLSKLLRMLLENESIACEEGEGRERRHGPLLRDFTPVQGMIRQGPGHSH